MRPPKQKQPQVKKGRYQVLEYVDVDVEMRRQLAFLTTQHTQAVGSGENGKTFSSSLQAVHWLFFSSDSTG